MGGLLESRCAIAGDEFNLDPGGFWEGTDLNGRTGGRVRLKKIAIDFVHSCEFAEIRHKDGGFHDIRGVQSLVFQNGEDILENLAGLFFDPAGDEGSFGIEWNLAG